MAEDIRQATVVSLKTLTPHVKEVVLLPADRTPSYLSGQWISLKIPMDDKPAVNRAYSMAEPTQPNGCLALVFDHVPGGIGSEYLSSLREGDRVLWSGPHGKFVLPAYHHKRLLFIGRYTGIVPIRCMVRDLRPDAGFTALTIIQAAPAQDELLYHEEFLRLAKDHPNIEYVPVVAALDTDLAYVTQLVAPLLALHRDLIPMICGIKEFVRPLRAMFLERGYDRRDVKVETYN